MATTIYYFSATGNSLAVAKKLQQQLDDCRLIPIASLANARSIKPGGETVGFVFPLYYMGIPLLVKDFLEKISLDGVRYIFAVVTKGNPLAGGAIPQLAKIMKRWKYRLDAGFYITLPDNYIPMLNLPREAEQRKQFQACEVKIPQIVKYIKTNARLKERAFGSFLRPLIYNRWAANVRNSDRRFTVEDSCISCGVCEQVCPVNNIKMSQTEPEWLHHCEECLACLHHCPKQAIQCGKSTKKKPRYRHPEVLVAEIVKQKTAASPHPLSDQS
ncbi:MAG: 4Fe-4S binding protein [Firmicutes bacterium]|nr:4Fe-4S binding protein [Bacillota bacterium]